LISALAAYAQDVETPSESQEKAPIPRRIVTIAPNAAEMIHLLGAGDRIVGVSKFCAYPPELLDRPRVGGLFDPDLERIIALHPDLVVLRGRCPTLEELCLKQGIEVYRDRTESLSDMQRTIRELGAALDRADRAEEIVRSFRADLARIRARVADRKRPRVLVTASRRPGELGSIMTFNRNTFVHEMIEIAGGHNVFGDHDMNYPAISLEAVLARDVAFIIELMLGEEDPDALASRVRLEWSRFDSVPAVARGQVHVITDAASVIPSPRCAQVIEKISHILHPEPCVEQ
jgi:iron complex transport system substrate-binding protein